MSVLLCWALVGLLTGGGGGDAHGIEEDESFFLRSLFQTTRGYGEGNQ